MNTIIKLCCIISLIIIILIVIKMTPDYYFAYTSNVQNMHIGISEYTPAFDNTNIKIKKPKLVIDLPPTEEYCLQEAIYWEARNQGTKGMTAVANVIMNRVHDKNYPKTVCGVAHQAEYDDTGEIIRDRCQFSYHCDGRSDIPNLKNLNELIVWNEANSIAIAVLKGEGEDVVGPSLHYHADYVRPKWADDYQLIATIGTHVFYN